MFSSRLPAELAPSDWSVAVARAREAGRIRFDLTETNPTAVGLPYPENVLAPLGDPAGCRYDPHPLGGERARRAVAAELCARHAAVDWTRIVLTASTSEAYSVLFKLLCNPGDSLLVPQPSYPLFDLLTRLDAVRAVPYRLRREDDWAIDRASVEHGLSSGARAILLVSPNNPTGSMLHAADREWLVHLAADRQLALVADEVFAEYPLKPAPQRVSLAGEARALTFALGGLSKSAGLPQVKLAWIAVSGPDFLVRDALERIELVTDTYLSVATPVQQAAPELIATGHGIRRLILARVRRNLEILREEVRLRPAVTLLEPEAGWSAVLQVPATASEDEIVRTLLDRSGVLVHPGYFFDFPDEAYLVLSLLPDTPGFRDGVSRMLDMLAELPC